MVKGAGLKILWLSAFVGSNPIPRIFFKMEGTTKTADSLWNVAITREFDDFNGIYRYTIYAPSARQGFEAYVERHGLEVVAEKTELTDIQIGDLTGCNALGQELKKDHLM